MTSIAVLLMTLFTVASAGSEAKPVQVFILADQSNMEGAG